MIEAAFHEAVVQQKRLGLFRSLSGACGLIDFASNDYLGLSADREIRLALTDELKNGCPLGATGSRLVSGQTEYHERAESFLAETFKVPSALLFSSGFMANLGVLTALGSLDAEFFCDELNHASLIDGVRLAGRPKTVFRHNDLSHLDELLSKSRTRVKAVVTESVFSMDGDLSPIGEILEICDRRSACLVLDEAHATGVFGGRRLGRYEGPSARAPVIQIHTGSKALGGQGAFVLSDFDFRQLMINRARSFIFTTGLAPLSAFQIELALRKILITPNRLLEDAASFRAELEAMGISTPSRSQIIPVILGSNERALKAAERLRDHGIDARAIRYPTVPPGTERLRITLKSFHTTEQRERLLELLREAAK